jgi:CheY-like chemotaxis protein
MGPKLRCLVVDDDPDWVELICRCMTLSGCRMDAVKFNHARAALAFLQREHVDLIVTDLRMPDVDGLTLIEEIRRFDPVTPIVLVSSDESAAAQCPGAGPTVFVRKGELKSQLGPVVRELTTPTERSRAR